MSEYAIHALTTLLVSLEPPGLAPIFIALSVGMSQAERRKAAFGAATISVTVLLGFAVFGDASRRRQGRHPEHRDLPAGHPNHGGSGRDIGDDSVGEQGN